jgi:hypothetical protein
MLDNGREFSEAREYAGDDFGAATASLAGDTYLVVP